MTTLSVYDFYYYFILEHLYKGRLIIKNFNFCFSKDFNENRYHE